MMNNALCPTPDELKPGSTVEIETAFNEIIVGEVYCFDYPSRILTLSMFSFLLPSSSFHYLCDHRL